MKDESNATTELVRAETQWNRGWDERWETGSERQRETGGEAEWEGGWKTESEMEGERQRMSDRECVWETENEWLRVCEGERGRVSVWEIERACSGCLGHRPIPPLSPLHCPWYCLMGKQKDQQKHGGIEARKTSVTDGGITPPPPRISIVLFVC